MTYRQQGQKILLDDFDAIICLLIFEDMDDKDVSAAREKIEDSNTWIQLWYDSIADIQFQRNTS